MRRGEIWTAAEGSADAGKLRQRVGRLGDDDMVRLGRAVMVFSGLGGG